MIEPIPFFGWVEIDDTNLEVYGGIAQDIMHRGDGDNAPESSLFNPLEEVVCELSVILPKQMVKRNDCVVCYDRQCKYYIPIKVVDYGVLK